jgi:hypothetical protein
MVGLEHVLAKVFKAATGSSMSINIRSCENLLRVTPVSVVEKNVIGELNHLVKPYDEVDRSSYLSTVFNSFQWKLTPERGTIVIMSCLAKCQYRGMSYVVIALTSS